MSDDKGIYFVRPKKGGKMKVLPTVEELLKHKMEGHYMGGQFELPKGTNPKPLLGEGGHGQLHIQEVQNGVNLDKHFKKFLALAEKDHTGGVLTKTDMDKLHDYTALNGAGFFDSLWSGVKSVAKVALPIASMVVPEIAPIAGVASKLLGGSIKRKPKHVREVMTGINLPKHFNKYLSLIRKTVAGGELGVSDMKKLKDYQELTGGGFFDSLWSGIKSVARVVAPILGTVLTPVLGPVAPIVGNIIPKLIGGGLTGKHVMEVSNGVNLKKHFKKFLGLARVIEDGGSLTTKNAKMFGDYKALNAGGFFDSLWKGIKSVGSTVIDNLPAIIEHAPKVIEYGKKAYDFVKK